MRLNPTAFDQWILGLPENENFEDWRTPLTDPSNATSPKRKKALLEAEEANREVSAEADRVRAEREKKEHEQAAPPYRGTLPWWLRQ